MKHLPLAILTSGILIAGTITAFNNNAADPHDGIQRGSVQKTFTDRLLAETPVSSETETPGWSEKADRIPFDSGSSLGRTQRAPHGRPWFL